MGDDELNIVTWIFGRAEKFVEIAGLQFPLFLQGDSCSHLLPMSTSTRTTTTTTAPAAPPPPPPPPPSVPPRHFDGGGGEAGTRGRRKKRKQSSTDICTCIHTQCTYSQQGSQPLGSHPSIRPSIHLLTNYLLTHGTHTKLFRQILCVLREVIVSVWQNPRWLTHSVIPWQLGPSFQLAKKQLRRPSAARYVATCTYVRKYVRTSNKTTCCNEKGKNYMLA